MPEKVNANASAGARHPKVWWMSLFEAAMAPWIRASVEWRGGRRPEEQPQKTVCYVLEVDSLSNLLILDRACRDADMPSPLQTLHGSGLGRKRAYLGLPGAMQMRDQRRPEQRDEETAAAHPLARLIQAHRENPALDVQLVPVSIFVGRAPERRTGWFSVLFSENWTLMTRMQRLFAIALNGRDTLLQFDEPIAVRTIAEEELDVERAVRKTYRQRRSQFRKVREALIGPDLSTRRVLIDKVLAADEVQQAIKDQSQRDGTSPEKALQLARDYAWEIAADYSHPVVRSASLLLSSVWNRIYRGVLVHHLDEVRRNAPGHEVVYVPSHRSHMDDLLLPYLLYTNGIVPPHIVAGINLNLPLVGTLLRRGGAFFIRRSIRGNMLYSVVLGQYIAQLVSGGYSMAYFIEGGRSRTGRLLPPKRGAVAMTVRAYLAEPTRPVLFQPVYIGYEKLMEGGSYLDELSGKTKKAESLWQLISGIPRVLRSNYGQVVVNFGEPIRLTEVLTASGHWNGGAAAHTVKLPWLPDVVDTVTQRIQVNINRAADLNPINLLALALLSTPKHAMSEQDLQGQITLSQRLARTLPYSDKVTVTPHTAAEIIAHGEEIGILRRTAHPFGDVFFVSAEDAVLLSYFRNNVLHLFTTTGWIACCFQHNHRMSRAQLIKTGRSVYPFLQNELFLAWSEDEFADHLDATVNMFIEEQLLVLSDPSDPDSLARRMGQSDEVFRLRALGHPLQQAFERYYITMCLLAKNGPGALGMGQLESLCQSTAQRLSLLYAPAAPEFFDKTLFKSFIQKLRELGLVWLDENAKLSFDGELRARAREARFILGRELRNTIEMISPGEARAQAPSGSATVAAEHS